MSDETYESGSTDGPLGHPDTAFCHCGEAWFTIEGDPSGVALNGRGEVKSYAGFLRCIGCGDLKPLGFTGDHPLQT